MPRPATPPELRRKQRVIGLLLGLLLLLTGCGPPSPAATPAATASSSAESGARAAVAAMTTALRTHDRTAFDARVSTRDPAFAPTADLLFGLSALPITALDLSLRPRQSPLTPARRALLGPRAFVQQVAVTWRLVGDGGPAQHLLWLTFRPEAAGVSVAGTTDWPGEAAARPLWLVQALTSLRSDETTVLGPAGTRLTAWLRRGDAAVSAVRSRLVGGLGSSWNHALVIEVPSTRQAFEQVLGVPAGSYASIAAVAWPEGPEAGTAAIRVVVNPAQAGRLDEQALAVLLAHETTHVATRSAASRAPTWLVEGLADYVAYDAYPGTAALAAAPVLTQVRAQGPPRSLPADADFTPTAPDLSRTYATAWLACRFLADTWSPRRLEQVYARADAGTRVDEVLQRELGLSERAFLSRWGVQLRAAAQRG